MGQKAQIALSYAYDPVHSPLEFQFEIQVIIQQGRERSCRNRAMEIERGRSKRSGSTSRRGESTLTRAVNAVFSFVRFAEFEILFFLFFFIAFLLFKDFTSRPEYNQILVKKPDREFWPY